MTEERQMSTVRMSRCGAFVLSGTEQLVWDDYLGQTQTALRPPFELLATACRSWTSIEDLAVTGARLGLSAAQTDRACRQLVDRNILVERASSRDRLEEQVLESWDSWGFSARHLHFASRTLHDTPFSSREEDNARLAAKYLETPAPPAYLSVKASEVVNLPERTDPRSLLEGVSLGEALHRRRSRRTFGDEDLGLDDLVTVLRVAADPVRAAVDTMIFPNASLHKISPSGGGRHPTEFYVYARRVDGLKPGVYHYDAPANRLDRVAEPVTDEEIAHACGGQAWAADAGALLLYVGVVARSVWKYDMARAYRALCMDVGHLSQTVYLTCTALGLHITFIGSFRDEDLEFLTGVDFTQHAVLGMSVIGRPSGIPLIEEAAYRLGSSTV